MYKTTSLTLQKSILFLQILSGPDPEEAGLESAPCNP